ncbi:MAG: hypothetical protein LBC18_12205 [Opitutaceae bacterium]|nr:hypothetical protein [Opitutaceae bacterium]
MKADNTARLSPRCQPSLGSLTERPKAIAAARQPRRNHPACQSLFSIGKWLKGPPLKIEQKAAKRTKDNRGALAVVYLNLFLANKFKPAVKSGFLFFIFVSFVSFCSK